MLGFLVFFSYCFVLVMVHECLMSYEKCQKTFQCSCQCIQCSWQWYPYTSQKNISPKIICQKNISMNVLFPEITLVRNHACQNEHLLEITSARMNTGQKLHLPELTFV